MRGVVEESILAGREVIESDHLVAAREQRIGEMAADETSRAGDQVSQATILRAHPRRFAALPGRTRSSAEESRSAARRRHPGRRAPGERRRIPDGDRCGDAPLKLEPPGLRAPGRTKTGGFQLQWCI